MTLAPGTRLGPYEIISPRGAGGLGEVYKARDTRLDREVAVKVIAAELSASIKAHRHGIVHRDLKPGNIMLTGSFIAMVTDIRAGEQPLNVVLNRAQK